MQDNELIIEMHDEDAEYQEKSAQMLLAFIINEFNGKNVSYDYIRKMICHAGGPEFSDKDVTECVSRALLGCNDSEMQDWIGHHVHKYQTAFI